MVYVAYHYSLSTTHSKMSDALYQAHILDHYRRPRNFGDPDTSALCALGTNPSCGDTLTFCVDVEDGVIVCASFQGTGCAISQALASMLTEHVRGMSHSVARAMTEQDAYALLGVPVSAGREKCATLALRALHSALDHYEA